MVEYNGMKAFGWAQFMPYGEDTGDWEELKHIKNAIDRKAVVSHIEDESIVDFGAAAMPSEVIPETGELVEAGMYVDGPYRFPAGFLHYYRNGVVGIPHDYEEYLHREFGL